MAITNTTKNKIIVDKQRFCNSIFSKAIGLMFSKKIKNKGLIFIFKKEKKLSLHMFFVFYPIDVLFLDKDKKVIETKNNFKPFTFYSPKQKARFIIELPKNTIKATKTELDDIIDF